jgi:uncharacterized protein YydD (DUF2326 family)
MGAKLADSIRIRLPGEYKQRGAMTIRFYDVEIEEMREATQEDWDRLRDSLIKLQRHIEKLEGSRAVTMGTLEAPAADDAPFTVTPAESNTPR